MEDNQQYLEEKIRFNDLPITILYYLSSFLSGFDALSFGECVSKELMGFNRQFWLGLGRQVILNIYAYGIHREKKMSFDIDFKRGSLSKKFF